MEQLKDVLEKTTPTPTSTSETKIVQLPGPGPEKVWSCNRCNEQYPVSAWEQWSEANSRLVDSCLRCRRKEQADAIRRIRGNTEQILFRAGFSEVLAAKTIRDLKTKGAFSPERKAEVKEIAFSIFDSKRRTKRGVCFIGPVGTGKTQWATLMAKRYVRKGWQSVAMCRLPRFLDRARDQYNRHFDGRESIEEMLKYYLNEQFLVFDDMGVRQGEATSFEQNILYRLIDERHFIAHKTYTVITTNRPLEEMDRDIDERVRSRIMEMCHVVHLDGPDWRAEVPD